MRPLQIQWRKDGVPIPGATNESLRFDYVELSDAGNYSVAVTNAFAGDISDEAALTVGYGLEVRVVGPGTVQGAPDLEVYPPGSVVELTAVTTRSNHVFVEWSGDATGTARTVTLTLDREDYAVTATFDYLFPDVKWYSHFSDAPALGGNGVLYAFAHGVLTAFDMTTGHTNWAASALDGWWAPAAIAADGTLYAGDYFGSSVWAFDPLSGERKWGFRVDVCVHGCPAIGVDGTLYLSGMKLYAVDPVTRSKKWSFEGGSFFDSSPAISADAVVYAGCYDGKMYAFNSLTGEKLWEFATGAGIHSSPALGSDGTVYFGSLDGKVYAVDGSTGTERWQFVTADAISASAVIGQDGTVYIGSEDNYVYALNGETGALKWQFNAASRVQATGALAEDGTLYISAQYGPLYALDSQTGRKLWEFPGAYGSPAIGLDGTIYCGGFALLGSSPLASSPWPKFHRDNHNRGRVHARPIAAAKRRDADLEITIYSEPGERLRLEWTDDWQTWNTGEALNNTTGTLNLLEPLSPLSRFYRVRVE
jgi:outer membrane protein assembly factor BamB